MNATRHAIGVGLRRGWTETVKSLRSPQDQGFYVMVGLGTIGWLYSQRRTEVEGTDLLLPALLMPSLLALLLVFGLVVGPMYTLALEREDGTLLRAKAAPKGMVGYVAGQLVLHSVSLVPLLAVILVPGVVLFDGLFHRGLAGGFTVAWVLLLGLAAVLPIGMILGSLVPGVQKVGTWGMVPVGALGAISGIFFDMENLWGWVQGVAQVFPVYWLGIGMRSAFLPDSAAALEISGTWRTLPTVAVLSAWAVVGSLTAPLVLRRMAERQSGAAVAEARDNAVNIVR